MTRFFLLTPTPSDSSRRLRRALAGSLLALAAFAGPVPAMAANTYAAHQVTVRYGDLDLKRPEGAATLYRRLRHASREVCGYYETGVATWSQQRRCYERALHDAVQRVDRPTLAALHLARWKAAVGG